MRALYFYNEGQLNPPVSCFSGRWSLGLRATSLNLAFMDLLFKILDFIGSLKVKGSQPLASQIAVLVIVKPCGLIIITLIYDHCAGIRPWCSRLAPFKICIKAECFYLLQGEDGPECLMFSCFTLKIVFIICNSCFICMVSLSFSSLITYYQSSNVT